MCPLFSLQGTTSLLWYVPIFVLMPFFSYASTAKGEWRSWAVTKCLFLFLFCWWTGLGTLSLWNSKNSCRELGRSREAEGREIVGCNHVLIVSAVSGPRARLSDLGHLLIIPMKWWAMTDNKPVSTLMLSMQNLSPWAGFSQATVQSLTDLRAFWHHPSQPDPKWSLNKDQVPYFALPVTTQNSVWLLN